MISICWLVCLSVSMINQKVADECHEMFGRVNEESVIDFGASLQSDLGFLHFL